MPVTMDKLVALCKTRGFVFPGSDIYGGLANSWDYGPLGVELKNNVKQLWWKTFVQERLDMVGIDAALIMNPKVWEASGHVATFSDPLVECKECHSRYRADQLQTYLKDEKSFDNMKKVMRLGLEMDNDKVFDANKDEVYWECEKCKKKNFGSEPREFNLMMKTFLGSTEDASAVAYFRPETAQAMFVDFPLVLNTSRKRVPFGIAQIGKAFRNEITPGNFIFRTREFEQMEIEYFIHPSEWEKHFEAWLAQMHRWTDLVGITGASVHDLEVSEADRAFYSKRTVDLEFDYPFGRKELYGLAYRTDYDLGTHAKHSGATMTYTDPVTNEKYVPHVIEPSFGVDRTVLAILLSAYDEETLPAADGEPADTRVVLRFKKAVAPIKVAILPLSKKEELSSVARPIAERLAKRWRVDYDETQSIGKRYRRQDEIGTPFCVTVDFDTVTGETDPALKDTVTVRERDSMKQERVAIAELEQYLVSQFTE